MYCTDFSNCLSPVYFKLMNCKLYVCHRMFSYATWIQKGLSCSSSPCIQFLGVVRRLNKCICLSWPIRPCSVLTESLFRSSLDVVKVFPVFCYLNSRTLTGKIENINRLWVSSVTVKIQYLTSQCNGRRLTFCRRHRKQD